MPHPSHPRAAKGLQVVVLATLLGTWLITAIPVFAQETEPADPSMIEELLSKPDVVAPLAIPMILALGGILTLMAFLGWVSGRMPEDSETW